MLTNYDLLVESLLNEGRKKDELKKFKFNLDSVKKLVDDLNAEDEHKGHFKSIILKIKDKDFYTPKTFKSAISLIFKQLKKGEIADGYATIFYDWLKNHDECPLEDYNEKELDEPASEETAEWFNKDPKENDIDVTKGEDVNKTQEDLELEGEFE